MFDSIHHHETRNVNVTEHRAPTNESVSLLAEFERAVADLEQAVGLSIAQIGAGG